tara:strand:- start:1581 stop:1835 length:255 start_codon:yes stop_codon:yes gene_type:complete
MRVMVIVSDQNYSSHYDPFPPVGTKGTVTEGLDCYGEYEVKFDNYPSTTLNDPYWTTHKSMIVFIDDYENTQKLNECRELSLHK